MTNDESFLSLAIIGEPMNMFANVKGPLTLSSFLSLEPLGAVGGPGKESQSRRWQMS